MLQSCTLASAVATANCLLINKCGRQAMVPVQQGNQEYQVWNVEQLLQLGLRLGAYCLQVHSRAYVGQDAHRMFPMIDLCNHSQHAANVEG